MSAGDEIYLLDGTVVYVTGSELEQLPETIKVYNLEVADFNTYFLGDEAVLVHNYTGSKGDAPDSLLQGDKENHVYLGMKDNKPVYVGITKDVPTRQNQHGDRFDLLNEITTEPLTRRQARAIEQVLIEQHPEYENLINSIGSKRDWYDDAIEWGHKWLGEHGY